MICRRRCEGKQGSADSSRETRDRRRTDPAFYVVRSLRYLQPSPTLEALITLSYDHLWYRRERRETKKGMLLRLLPALQDSRFITSEGHCITTACCLALTLKFEHGFSVKEAFPNSCVSKTKHLLAAIKPGLSILRYARSPATSRLGLLG